MIDIHCHLLPGIDDGSDSPESSLEQLRLMEQGGITHAFLTAHFMPGHYHYDRGQYDDKLTGLRQLAADNGIGVALMPGFEIYLHPFSSDDIDKHRLTLGDSRYILVETDLNGLPKDFYDNIYPLLRKGYKPILAHAERYVSIMKDPHAAKELIHEDVYLQVNSGSLLGQYGEKVRQTAWVLLRNGWAHLLGSDDHVRAPYGSYFQALELLRERLDGTTAELLTEDFPRILLNNETIPFKYVYFSRPHQHHSERKGGFWQRVLG
jgi:protein-tyrosine phosphatase